MQRINNLKNLLDRRKELRNNSTKSEDIIWSCIKNKKLGVKFRRQHSIGGYILDFYCIEKKLVLEIDGEIHNTPEAKEYDKIRDKFFIGLGFTVIRFKTLQVENNLDSVIESIKNWL